MPDSYDKEKRSEVMRNVRSNNNKSTELELINQFKYFGIKGWRRNYEIKGKPDFVFHKEKVAVFADGCFWHGHDCRGLTPKANSEYWKAKIERNKKRDAEVTMYISKLGWTVVRVWECEIKKGKAMQKIAETLNEKNGLTIDLDGIDDYIFSLEGEQFDEDCMCGYAKLEG